ncbi:MAG: hypothetical protein JJ992_07605, partial [Planctomycetes bacterium]|nr:hypothetical protein [Planctomycetota bacterium]
MPRFFGLLNHVEPGQRAETMRREAVEIHAASFFLQNASEAFEFLDPPSGTPDSSAEERAERGRQLFQTQGCLVCHKHRDFKDAESFRDAGSDAVGPDLTKLGDKLRGPDARRWLYTWISQPALYDPQTVMPAINLEAIVPRDAGAATTSVADPVEDLVAYLLKDAADATPSAVETDIDAEMLDTLVLEHLKKEFPDGRAVQYRDRGIPSQLQASLKDDERDLVVPDQARDRPGFRLGRDAKLRYLGRKTIARYGCYGCHDIPGFENAKPIGIGLNDWGRKDPRMLAFDHVAEYAARFVDDNATAPTTAEASQELDTTAPQSTADRQYFLRQLRAGNRIGFLQQKLAEPRSFDYGMLDTKAWNDRLRMPQFSFSPQEREAVMTFVLGLVAQPPRSRYVYEPDEQRLAVMEGQQVLDRYRCRGCHMLRAERWDIEFPPGTFPQQPRQPTYPFADHEFSAAVLQASNQPDRRGLLRAALIGEPVIGDDGQPVIYDDYGDELFDDEQYSTNDLEFAFQLWNPVALEGQGYQVGEA